MYNQNGLNRDNTHQNEQKCPELEQDKQYQGYHRERGRSEIEAASQLIK